MTESGCQYFIGIDMDFALRTSIKQVDNAANPTGGATKPIISFSFELAPIKNHWGQYNFCKP
jgi:hypothetical protein